MSIIGISGKIGSGKDTVAKMIQHINVVENNLHGGSFLSHGKPVKELETKDIDKWLFNESDWQIKRFADKLKDMVCLILGCTRQQLEDREFKEKPLEQEWWKFKISKHNGVGGEEIEYRDYLTHQEFLEEEMIDILKQRECVVELIKMTPRLLMQLIGTEAGREIIHPNIWVNALFAEYKGNQRFFYTGNYVGRCKDCGKEMHDVAKLQPWCLECSKKVIYPNWLIPDTRFPNEAQAVKDRDGILIRVNRPLKLIYPDEYFQFEIDNTMDRYDFRDFLKEEKNVNPYHPSEIALDNWNDWDYVIDNNGTLEQLLTKVKDIYAKVSI